jgi:cytoskeletal protein RodZ
MYTDLATLCALLTALVSTLAEPNQSISLAGRRHGLRRSGLCNRAGRDGGRGSAHKSATSSSTVTTPSTPAKTQVASQVTAAELASTSAPTTAVPVSSVASPAASSGAPPTNDTATGGNAALTPNGIKAGMTLCTGLDEFTGKLGWCYGMSTS